MESNDSLGDRRVLVPGFVTERRSLATEYLDEDCTVNVHRYSPKRADRPDRIIVSALVPFVCDTMIQLTPEQVVHIANTMLTDGERAHIKHPAQSRLAELQAETNEVAAGITDVVRDISDSLDRQAQRDRDQMSPLRESTVLTPGTPEPTRDDA